MFHLKGRSCLLVVFPPLLKTNDGIGKTGKELARPTSTQSSVAIFCEHFASFRSRLSVVNDPQTYARLLNRYVVQNKGMLSYAASLADRPQYKSRYLRCQDPRKAVLHAKRPSRFALPQITKDYCNTRRALKTSSHRKRDTKDCCC